MDPFLCCYRVIVWCCDPRSVGELDAGSAELWLAAALAPGLHPRHARAPAHHRPRLGLELETKIHNVFTIT